ncbi:MAG: alcohol dehydrogenase catalytic domain-containing protein [Actinomycetota bacterium]
MDQLDHLPSTMACVICHGPHDYRHEEKPVPTAGPGEVLLRVHSAGLCASDVACWKGAFGYWPGDGMPGFVQPPVVPGHEFIGTVVGLGEGAGERHGLALGDTALSEQITPCWSCRFCNRGQYWMCHNTEIYGFRQHCHGAMSDYMVFPANAINHRVPATVAIDHGVFIEPLACAIHAVDRGDIQAGDTVVVAGCGPIGLGMIAAARRKQPGLLIASDLHPDRLALARACGADMTLDPGEVDVIDEVRGLTEGYGCDVFLEASGHPSAVDQGLRMLRKLGTFVVFGVFKEKVTTEWSIIGDRKELNVLGAHLGPYCYPRAIEMLADGVLPMDRIITHRLPFSQIDTALELTAGGANSVKVTLAPDA